MTQYVMDSVSPDKKEVVKTKQLEALKRLGHLDLKLDEYERAHSSPGPSVNLIAGR